MTRRSKKTSAVFTTHEWAHGGGLRVHEALNFDNEDDARAFARARSNEAGIHGVSITIPNKRHKYERIAYYVAGTDNINPTRKEPELMATATAKKASTGKKPSTTKKGKTRTPRAKRPEVKSKLSWDELLDMADLAVKSVNMKFRPALPKGVAFKDNFCDAYARFLSGGRRTHPGSQSRPFTNDELHVRRQYVRDSIAAVAAGKKQKAPSFKVLEKGAAKPKADKKPASTKKPAAPKKATTQAAAAHRRKRGASTTAKRTTSKRTTAKRGAAKRGRK